MKPERKKQIPNKKIITSAKFEAKEQFTKSALENLKTDTYMCRNIPYRCFYFCFDFLNLEKNSSYLACFF